MGTGNPDTETTIEWLGYTSLGTEPLSIPKLLCGVLEGFIMI